MPEEKNTNQEQYIEYLKAMGSLSKLFSDSNKPYLYYRLAENIYAESFKAKNVGRSDVAIDAVLSLVGVGLKTYTGHNSKASYQKVAEFNAQKPELERQLKSGADSFIENLALLRNTRIQFVEDAYSLSSVIYHSVVRDEYKFSILEEPMHKIDTKSTRIQNITDKTVFFHDAKGEYKFVSSKSTLYKKFQEVAPLYSFKVEILDNPLPYLIKQLSGFLTQDTFQAESIILPLYSTKSGKDYGQVPEKSGLNQWNADGRPRNKKEVYIPIPAWIHQQFPHFLPPRSEAFSLILPSGEIISCTVAQDNSKALMSNPNSKLGEWLIDEVLHLNEGDLITREILDRIGIDSVELTKKDSKFYLDFKKTGAYEKFRDANIT